MILLANNSGNFNLTTNPTVLTSTVGVNVAADAAIVLELGNGTQNLAGTAGTIITVTLTANGVPIDIPYSASLVTGTTRVRLRVPNRVIRNNESIVIKVSSNAGGDNNVNVNASIYAANPLDAVTGSNILNATFTNNTGANEDVSNYILSPATNVTRESTSVWVDPNDKAIVLPNKTSDDRKRWFQFNIEMAGVGIIQADVLKRTSGVGYDGVTNLVLYVDGVAQQTVVMLDAPTQAAGGFIRIQAPLEPGLRTIRFELTTSINDAISNWALVDNLQIWLGTESPLTYELGTQLLGDIIAELAKVPKVGRVTRHNRQDVNADQSKIVDVLLQEAT